jgi:hypothetical protein
MRWRIELPQILQEVGRNYKTRNHLFLIIGGSLYTLWRFQVYGSLSCIKAVKTLDKYLRTIHTLATLVRHTHWGVARGSDSCLRQSLAPHIFLRFSLTIVKSFSILRSTYLFATPLVSAGKPAIPHSQAVLTAMVDTASWFFCICCYLYPLQDMFSVGDSTVRQTGNKEPVEGVVEENFEAGGHNFLIIINLLYVSSQLPRWHTLTSAVMVESRQLIAH